MSSATRRLFDDHPVQEVRDDLQVSRVSSLADAFSQLADVIRTAQPKKRGRQLQD
jgi:hypothetical protein